MAAAVDRGSFFTRACVAFLAIFSVSTAAADEVQSPQFRAGLWSFQRTIERIREAPHQNQLLIKEETTRCVNPSLAMKGIFASPNIGNCTSSKPEFTLDRYVFANRCDYLGPVRTEIIVDNDASYTEINVLSVGNFPRRDMVVAQRLGDCENPAPGYQLTSSDGFRLSGTSRPVKRDR
jgi:hypothetical protein